MRQEFESDTNVFQNTPWEEPITYVIPSQEYFKKMGMDENGRYPRIVADKDKSAEAFENYRFNEMTEEETEEENNWFEYGI